MAEKVIVKPLNYDAMIQGLIDKIDGEESLFSSRIQFRGYWENGTVLVVVAFFIVMCTLALLSNGSALFDGLALIIALGALLVAFIFGIEDNTVKANYRCAIEKFKIAKIEKEERLLLRALIKMKAMNLDSKLGTVKEMHGDLFTKEKLLEKLYE